MTATDTQLVDDGVFYCDDADVFRYIRNKDYDDLPTDRSGLSQGGLTQADVDDLIAQKSEEVDRYTKRAWRTRKVDDVELTIRLSHKQKHARHRRRKIRGSGGSYGRSRHNYQVSQRTFVDLPNVHVKPIDSNEGDSVEVLNPRDVNDITADEGRQDGSYVVSNRKGVIRPELNLLTAVGTNIQGPTLDEGAASLRVSYRYGVPYDVTDYDADSDGVSDYVPRDVEDATAKLVVADLIQSDQYGQVIPNTGDDSPSLQDASSSFRDAAMNTLHGYRRA